MKIEPILQLKGVSKVFGIRSVLESINYSFLPGAIYGLVGPSGAGKSTLLRIINLLEEPSGGQVIFRGRPVGPGRGERLHLRRRMAMVFQQPVLFSGSVLDNVFYGLKVRGEKFSVHHKKLLQVLKKVGLNDLAQQRAVTLSGGEAQRLALARVMVLQPEILLLDEPTANLDPANIGIIEKLLRLIREEFGTTIIMVTHNLPQAKRLADEVVFIYEGKLVEAKPVDQFFQAAENPITRAFINGDITY